MDSLKPAARPLMRGAVRALGLAGAPSRPCRDRSRPGRDRSCLGWYRSRSAPAAAVRDLGTNRPALLCSRPRTNATLRVSEQRLAGCSYAPNHEICIKASSALPVDLL